MVEGQLVQEPVDYTAIQLLIPDWIVRWNSPLPQTGATYTEPMLTSCAEVEKSFYRSFCRHQQATPWVRFAYPTIADRAADLTVYSWLHIPLVTEPVEVEGAPPSAQSISVSTQTPAKMIVQLLSWLNVTHDELAGMSGVGRSTLFYWRKKGATPRTSNMRQIMRLYSIVALLVRHLGASGAQRWLQGEGRYVWECMKLGELDKAERELRARLFGQPSQPWSGGRAVPDGIKPPIGAASEAPMKRATRGSKKGRLDQR